MQNFTLLGATVAEISVAEHREKTPNLVLYRRVKHRQYLAGYCRRVVNVVPDGVQT